MTTLGLIAALILIPILLRVGMRLFASLFVRAALIKGAEDVGRRAVDKQPDTIHLTKRSPEVWAQPDAAGALATPLLENGFEDVGTFAINELPGVIVRLLVDAQAGLLGIVYEHPRVPHWVEVVTYFTSGGSATFTTLRPTGLAPRPGCTVTHCPGIDAGALLHRAIEERFTHDIVKLTPDVAVRRFENAWSEYMTWRKQHPVSAREVGQVAQRRAA